MGDVLTGADCIRGELIGLGKINVLKNCYRGAVAPADATAGVLWQDSADDLLYIYDGAAWNLVGAPPIDDNWTPTITFGGGSAGITYNAATTLGRYSLKGNWLFFSGRITLTSKGSAVGNAAIASLPYTVKNYEGAHSATSFFASHVSFANMLQTFVTPNTDIINIYEILENGTLSPITNVEFENDTDLIFSGMYEIEV